MQVKQSLRVSRQSKVEIIEFRPRIYDLQANFKKKFVDFCCNDIVAKSRKLLFAPADLAAVKRLALPFRHSIIITERSIKMVSSKKQAYSSPDLDIVDIYNSDVIVTSSPQGGGDGSSGDGNIDNFGWT